MGRGGSPTCEVALLDLVLIFFLEFGHASLDQAHVLIQLGFLRQLLAQNDWGKATERERGRKCVQQWETGNVTNRKATQPSRSRNQVCRGAHLPRDKVTPESELWSSVRWSSIHRSSVQATPEPRVRENSQVTERCWGGRAQTTRVCPQREDGGSRNLGARHVQTPGESGEGGGQRGKQYIKHANNCYARALVLTISFPRREVGCERTSESGGMLVKIEYGVYVTNQPGPVQVPRGGGEG